MNILRHKSWHVRNRNNINRVKKDEEKARNEELEKEKRMDLADSERRVQLLRQRLSSSGRPDTSVTVVQGSRHHLNIFEDFGDKIVTKNKEHQKEIKEENEKFEKKTGILQYLVDKDIDSEHNWYLDSHEKRMKLTDNKSYVKDMEQEFKDNKWKKFNDPLEDMKRYLDSMKPKKDSKYDNKRKTTEKSIKIDKKSESLDKISKKSKKSKKHKKKKRKRNSSESSDPSEDNRLSIKNTLEQLRAQRLERERIERERTRALLSGKSQTQTETVIMDDRLRTYNSQFNPDIARQNIDK